MNEAEKNVLDAAIELTDTILGESLKHPKHSRKLKPLRVLAELVMVRYFNKQLKALLKEIKPNLEAMAALMESETIGRRRLREAKDEEESQKAAEDALPDELLPLAYTQALGADYGKIMKATIESGYSTLADDLEWEGTPSDDFVGGWLRTNSLEKITGGIDETTIARLRNALADAYQGGADYEGLVDAVKAEYAKFNDVRAGMIAQTEMNSAYNAGRKQLGLDMGFNEKAWNPDGEACPICMLNVEEGWIGMDEVFSSGDDAPGAHPNCDCSLDVRMNAE